MPIKYSEIENGTRYEYNGYSVNVTNDERFFTIYRDGAPCGTITRPTVIGNRGKWSSHLLDGTVCTERGVGPRYAFARFIDADVGNISEK
jgi:hypothetical protein